MTQRRRRCAYCPKIIAVLVNTSSVGYWRVTDDSCPHHSDAAHCYAHCAQ